MRLLVISAGRWIPDGCFGSTYTSIFGGIPDLEIAQVYCGTGLPTQGTPQNVTRFFQTNEKRLLRNLLRPSFPAGAEVFRKDEGASGLLDIAEFSPREGQCINFLRRHHWAWLKYLNYYTIWNIGRWKSPALRQFIADFQPEAIWVATSPIPPVLRMAGYLKQITGLPLTGYIYDEDYSLKRFRFSPAYWLFHLATRRLIRKTVKSSSVYYVICDGQKEFYERVFGVPCRVITRTLDFNDRPHYIPHKTGVPYKLVYTGNLSSKRYRALMRIGEALRLSGFEASLDVYSAQPITRRMRRQLEKSGRVFFCGKVSGEEVTKILQQADILVHAEGFGRAYRLSARMAFSTKIVEYLSVGKPILAVGPREMNSIAYFDRHQAGRTAETIPEIINALEQLTDPAIAEQLVRNAWDTGVKLHRREPTQRLLFQELTELSQQADKIQKREEYS